MLNLKMIMANAQFVKEKLQQRNFDLQVIDQVLTLGHERSLKMNQLQSLAAQRNKLSKEIGLLKRKGQDSATICSQVQELKATMENLTQVVNELNQTLTNLMLEIPNLPSDQTPYGKGEADNQVIAEHANLGRAQVRGVLPHYELAVNLDIVDFQRAVKLAGSRFWAYKNQGARLVRALSAMMLDLHIASGYQEILPPLMVKTNIMQGTGQLPKFAADLFAIKDKKSWLIPTAEVPLTNFYANELIDLTAPLKLTAYTPCFRAEAGSGGKDTKGLIRAHQFNKVELVQIVTKEQLTHAYRNMLKEAKQILELLKLPYQEVQLCSADLGFAAEHTMDLEVWIPSEKRYREVSSISSFGDFQGRRANIRYKDQTGKNQYAYTLNGSALAIDRTIAAILENYQNADGSVTIPQVLRPYMNHEEFIK